MPRSTLPKRLAGFPFVARLLAAVVATALLLPGAAWAADVNATPSNLASVYAAAQGGDVIHLAAGNYGTFSGGSKSSMVTLIAQPGAVASIAPNLGGSVNNVTFDGLTIQGVYTNGARNVSFVNSKFTSMARIDTPVTGANILFDRVVFDGIDACGTCYEGRLTVRGYDNTSPVGVKITNSHFGNGGCSDGVQIIGNAYGVQVGPGNDFGGLRQGSCAAHVDSIQLYGSSHTQIVGNYFHDSDTDIMAPDGGDVEMVSDNVFIGAGYRPTVQMGSQTSSQFVHNTVKNADIYMDAKTGGASSTNGVLRDNVVVDGTLNAPSTKCSSCTVSYNLFNASGNENGTNTVIGTPVFTGGSSPTTYSGYALASGSPGTGNASDGTDRGIRVSGSTTSPPPPDPTPTPTDHQPVAAYSYAPSAPTTGKAVSFDASAATCEDTPCSYTWEDDGTDGPTGGQWPLGSGKTMSFTFQEVGTKYVRLTVTDTDGDTATTMKAINVTATAPADTTAPDTTISSGPTGTTNDNTPTFAFSATESGSTFQCRVDSGSWVSCASPWTTAALADGSHSVSVRATDAAGNVDASPATRSFTVSTAPPTTTISSGPASSTTSTSASFTFTASDPAATFSCSLDAAAYQACTSPKSYSALAVGSHTFAVKATNANGTGAAATRAWTITALASGSMLLGSQSVQSGQDSNAAGSAEAFLVTAGASGQAIKLSVYVDGGSSAATMVAGIYSDASGHPGTLMTKGSRTGMTAGAWNSVTIPAATISAGQKYWVALLGTGGTLKFRDSGGTASSCRSEGSSSGSLTTLPATWQTGATWASCNPSAYATS